MIDVEGVELEAVSSGTTGVSVDGLTWSPEPEGWLFVADPPFAPPAEAPLGFDSVTPLELPLELPELTALPELLVSLPELEVDPVPPPLFEDPFPPPLVLGWSSPAFGTLSVY